MSTGQPHTGGIYSQSVAVSGLTGMCAACPGVVHDKPVSCPLHPVKLASSQPELGVDVWRSPYRSGGTQSPGLSKDGARSTTAASAELVLDMNW